MNLDLREISHLINEKESPQKGRILASALFMETILISLAVWELGLTQSKVTIPETLPNMQLQLIHEENKKTPVTEKKNILKSSQSRKENIEAHTKAGNRIPESCASPKDAFKKCTAYSIGRKTVLTESGQRNTGIRQQQYKSAAGQ